MPQTQNITIYSTATCAYCQAEKKFLQEHDIAFTEVRVDADEAEAEKMIKLSGQMGVPFTVIKDGDQEDHIVGFDQKRISAALGL